MAINASELLNLGHWRKPSVRAGKAQHRPQLVRLEELARDALWSPLRDVARLCGRERALVYCRYVRVLITADSLAGATGMTRATAAEWLERFTRDKILKRTGGLRNGNGRPASVWEWVDV